MVVDCGSLDCRLGCKLAIARAGGVAGRCAMRCYLSCGAQRAAVAARSGTVRLVRIRPNFSTISYVLPCLQAKLGCQHDVEKEADDGPAMDGAGSGGGWA